MQTIYFPSFAGDGLNGDDTVQFNWLEETWFMEKGNILLGKEVLIVSMLQVTPKVLNSDFCILMTIGFCSHCTLKIYFMTSSISEFKAQQKISGVLEWQAVLGPMDFEP